MTVFTEFAPHRLSLDVAPELHELLSKVMSVNAPGGGLRGLDGEPWQSPDARSESASAPKPAPTAVPGQTVAPSTVSANPMAFLADSDMKEAMARYAAGVAKTIADTTAEAVSQRLGLVTHQVEHAMLAHLEALDAATQAVRDGALNGSEGG